MKRFLFGLAATALALAGPALALPPLSPADRAAAFRAAGYKPAGKDWVRCQEEGTGQRPTGNLEVADLNGDGRPEAWIRESSSYCFGATGEAVTLVTKGADGTWRNLLDEVGIESLLASKHNGWPDVTIGGPGFGPVPVFGFNGKTYAKIGMRRQ
jgi:hypothetical protein